MALYTPEYKPTGKEVAIIKTSQGTIRVELDGEGAPIHVGNFVELAQKGFYDNLKFHSYVPGFVIQGGDPNTRDLDSEQVKAAECPVVSTWGAQQAHRSTPGISTMRTFSVRASLLR